MKSSSNSADPPAGPPRPPGLFAGPVKVAALLLAFIALQMITGGYAFRLDGERLRPLWTLPLQQFVYRQLPLPRHRFNR